MVHELVETSTTDKNRYEKSQKGVPELIKRYNPKAKVIVITCSPSGRAYSDYLHMQDLTKRFESENNSWPGPLANLLARDFKNISSFEILGSSHKIFLSRSAPELHRKCVRNERKWPEMKL